MSANKSEVVGFGGYRRSYATFADVAITGTVAATTTLVFDNKINYKISESIISGPGLVEYIVGDEGSFVDGGGLVSNINPLIFLPSPFELGLDLTLTTPMWFVNTPTPTWVMGEPLPSERIDYVDRNGLVSGTATVSPPQNEQLTSYTFYYVGANESVATGGGEVRVNDGGKPALLLDGTEQMAGDIDLGGFNVINSDLPTNPTDLASKIYVDTLIGGGSGPFLELDGTTTMTGEIDAGTNKVINVATPTAGTDAPNKDYVDTAVAGAAIFGSQYQSATSEGLSNTTNASFVQKLKLTTPVVPAGTYLVHWTAEGQNTEFGGYIDMRIQEDDTIDHGTVRVWTGDEDTGPGMPWTDNFRTFSGHVTTTLTAVAHEFDIDFLAGMVGSAEIRRARIVVHRIL